MPATKINICVMASGNGSNAINLINESLTRNHINIVCLICDNPKAKIFKSAEKFNIPTHLIPFAGNKKLHEDKIINILKKNNIHWILLAGYTRILSPFFINHFKSKIINIHPSYLPMFRGKDAYEQAFQANVSHSGVTIHFVDSGIDTGKIILQEKFPRMANDSLTNFKNRGLQLEHKLYPTILDIIIEEFPHV